MVNPVAFSLFGVSVYWYGIIIASAIVIGVWLAMRESRRRGIDPENIIDLCLWAVPFAVIGGAPVLCDLHLGYVQERPY